MNNFKICVLNSSYVQLTHIAHNHGLRKPAPIRSLKPSKVGADRILAGKPLQGRSVGGKKDPW